MNTTTSAALLLAFFCVYTQGSRLVYHNDAPSQPDELDLMELFIGEPPTGTNLVKRGGQSPKGTTGLWFGPRLGRRRRSLDGAETSREKRQIDNLIGNKEELIKLGQDGPWALVALRGGKRRNVNFTPRLGRDSEEEAIENFMEPAYSGYARTPTRSDGGQAAGNVGSNFTPRLGRLAPLDSH